MEKAGRLLCQTQPLFSAAAAIREVAEPQEKAICDAGEAVNGMVGSRVFTGQPRCARRWLLFGVGPYSGVNSPRHRPFGPVLSLIACFIKSSRGERATVLALMKPYRAVLSVDRRWLRVAGFGTGSKDRRVWGTHPFDSQDHQGLGLVGTPG